MPRNESVRYFLTIVSPVCGLTSSRFSHPQVLAAIGRGQEVMRESLHQRRPFAPEIGVFVDPRSLYWMRPTSANAALVLNQVALMPQAGAPWDFQFNDCHDSHSASAWPALRAC